MAKGHQLRVERMPLLMFNRMNLSSGDEDVRVGLKLCLFRQLSVSQSVTMRTRKLRKDLGLPGIV